MIYPTHRLCHNGKVEPIAAMSIYHLLAAYDHDASAGCKLWFDVVTSLSLYNVEEFREAPTPQFYTDILMLRALDSQMGTMPNYKHSHSLWRRFEDTIEMEYNLAGISSYYEVLKIANLPKPAEIDYKDRLYSNEGIHPI